MSIQENALYSQAVVASGLSIGASIPTTPNQTASFFGSTSAKKARSSSIGRTITTARPFAVFPGKRTVRNNVGRNNPNFYRFTVDNVSNLRLTFKNRAKNSIVSRVLNEQGQVISLGKNRLSQRVRSGDTFERTYKRLPSGTYFLQVTSQGKGQNAYRLTLGVSNTTGVFPGCGCGQSS
jgi:hypothetical protein